MDINALQAILLIVVVMAAMIVPAAILEWYARRETARERRIRRLRPLSNGRRFRR